MLNLASFLSAREWRNLLRAEFQSENFKNLERNLAQISQTTQIYPPLNLIFNALNLTPLSNLKVVIIGQDPYHGAGEAMGLAFSVPEGVKIPPSLKNIFKEIIADVGSCALNNGDLTPWARQGVLLLNSTLSVSAGAPNSHAKLGWGEFTDAIIAKISENCENLVFMLWGNFAIKKANLIDANRHLILTAPHPSPLARGGFFGCRHFSKCNEYLALKGKNTILW
ncbi:uracil-DNA glycosylase [Campylobacter sp. JMF_08 NE1]|uniref:uracil-DNA glycosylase n=1 Tax=Campylobacter sp. JMF_08 NE1 TaxID=2983821 RepID=UPI0022E9E694|nr:uracil-DNA glycosylase [Campylobacter sp. JMF_08 NE1]MDA3048547.1 uracil-DNA glycosylase [Campylobacter sp. JMF_08 NE1]